MRVKQLWNYVPLPQSLRLVWDRLTFSQLTTVYFVVALIHCFIQVIFQISALLINQDATHVLAHIAAVDPNTPTGYAVLVQNGPLRACTGMPGSTGSTACQMVWAGKVAPDAFGDDGDYYNDPDNYVASTTVSRAALVSPSVQSSTTLRTTVVVTVSASSAASNTAIQTPSTSLRSVPVSTAAASSSTTISLASSTISVATRSTSSVPVSTSTTSPVAPAGSPVAPAGPARAKRMYIPAHVPGSKTHTFSKRDLSITPVYSQFNGTFQGVRLNGLSAANYGGSNQDLTDETEAFISSVCVDALQWPLQKLANTQREDAVFIGFQFWVLGMSVVALLNESVPHIIAAFLTHLLATGWSAFQLLHTANFRSEFNRLTTRGACGGVNLLPEYWRTRTNAEIPILVLNVVVLVGSGYMSWKLLKTFGWLTFKRVGASLEINRIYKVVLCLSIVLQISLFFLIVSMALWVEELYHGPAAAQTKLAPLYKAIVTIQLVTLVPWLVMGWYAVRREMRKTMIAFITLSALFVVAWAGMFVSPTWRLTFLTWMFFRIMSINAVVLTVLALGLGVVCFLNFGKDLPKHLRLLEDPEGGDFVPAQPSYDEKSEKVEFPAQNAFPTFSAAFPSRPTSMASSGTHTRTNSTESNAESVAPPHVVARLPTYRNFQVERPMSAESVDASVRDPFEHDLERVMSNNTYPTMRSVSSTQSVGAAPGPVPAAGMGKRWFIE